MLSVMVSQHSFFLWLHTVLYFLELYLWVLSMCTRPLSRALNSAADLLVDSMLEKLFRALWQKESVRHPHPFLQGMYLNFGGFSTFSLEPAVVWMLSSL